jgi:2,4-dienoyl-CoA reductase-like NADH-dependent reductase (Old Yellow Enzyme family)/thioredoxin reductase
LNMERMFKKFTLNGLELANRFVFPPIKTAYGTPQGTVTDRQLMFYKQIAKNGPAVVILEPVSITPEGREHPKQLCVHLPESTAELSKIVQVIHAENRLACLHVNHAGAAANPMATKTKPKAPSVVTCASTGQESDVLTEEEIETIFSAYKKAAEKAVTAGFDLIEIQGGHGYLISQFLNAKINKRTDRFGQDRVLFAREVLSAIKQGAPETPCILRISGNEMSPEYGISREDLVPLLILAQKSGIAAVHMGMGSSCFSPPWYFHHASLPEKPQMDTLSWVRKQTKLPLIIAGRMGRSKKILDVLNQDLADLVALGRPLIADPEFIEKLQMGMDKEIVFCGYCLQGCLHRLKSGEPLGCNLNPEMGQPELKPTTNPIKVLIAGGGPAGMSASLYLTRRGHKVTLVEKSDRLGGQFTLAWQAPGKEKMKDGLDAIEHSIRADNISILLNRTVDADLVKEIQPDLVVWATGALQNIPDIQGLDSQYTMTSLEYFQDEKEIRGPRVLVIGAGRVGVEIIERLGRDGYEVVATKRTDPIGSMMEMITKTLALKRIGEMPKVTIMPHTAVKGFRADGVEMEKDGAGVFMEPFQTVILASGMLSEACPDEEISKAVSNMEIIGDAKEVKDIYSAIHAGYELAVKY